MNLDEKTGRIVAQLLIPPELDLMLITDDGTIIRTPADSIRLTGRVAKGVRVMRLAEGSRIVSVTATERDEEDAAEDLPQDSGEAQAPEIIPTDETPDEI